MSNPIYSRARLLLWLPAVVWVAFFPKHVPALGVLLLTGVLVGIGLADPATRRRVVGRLDWPVLLFAVGMTLPLFSAPVKGLAWDAWRLTIYVLPCGYLCARQVILDPACRKPATVLLAVAVALVAFYGLFEWATARSPFNEFVLGDNPFAAYVTVRRPISTQLNPAGLGAFLLLGGPFLLVAWPPGPSAAYRRWGRGLAVVAGLVLVLSFSRSSVVGLVVAGALGLWLAGRKRLVWVLLGMALVVGSLGHHLPGQAQRLGIRHMAFSENGFFSAYRTDRLKLAVAMWMEHPVTGYGLGHVRRRFNTYYPAEQPERRYYARITDNHYAGLLAETGVVGLAGFLVLLGVSLCRGLRMARKGNGASRRAGGAVFLAVAGFAISIIGFDAYYWHGPMAMFGMVLGWQTAQLCVPDEKRQAGQVICS